MKLLSHIRSRSRLKSTDDTPNVLHHVKKQKTQHGRPWSDPTVQFPPALLEGLLTYVCPHAQDDTYISCEESMVDGGCMLCDMRDLSQCAIVNKQWSEAAQNLLYHNVRIDSVHYCNREADLAVKRKRRSFSPPQERLQLFSRTVRQNESLASHVQYLKIPYMTREACQADLARTVSVLPNLRYVDLPDGFYNDDPSSNTLKQELQSRCLNIRKMKYVGGAESSFQMLAAATRWRHLEALELSHLAIEPSTLVDVLASLTALREVKLVGLGLLDDSIFKHQGMLEFISTFGNANLRNSANDSGYTPVEPVSVASTFPPLAKLILEDTPNISAKGLVAYLSQLGADKTLNSLALTNTDISLSSLHQVVAAAPCLTDLHISQSVSRALPSSLIPPLASYSLRCLHYEISSHNSSPRPHTSPSDSYYAYLSASVLERSLPSLSHLYALSTKLPTLLLPPSRPTFTTQKADSEPPPLTKDISHPLHLYTKSISELEWNLTLITPPTVANCRGGATATRPMSLYYALQLSPQWREQGRESVMVGNGFGGFLAVPSNDGRPRSPKAKKEKKDADAWMG